MTAPANSRPQLKITRVELDTGRENVVVISRRSRALRPEVFRGFSRVEVRCNSRVMLATLLLTDDGLVAPDELGLSDPAFRRFAEPAGSLVTVTPAPPPESLDAVRAKIQGRALSAAEIALDRRGHRALPLFRHGDCRFPHRLGELHDQRRTAGAVARHGRGRHAAQVGGPHRRRQALYRRHPRQPHLDDRGADRRRARPDDPEDLLARHHLAGRHRRYHGSAGARRSRRRRDEGSGDRLPRLPGLGRPRQSVAGRRYPDLGRAAAQSRHPRADGGVDHVEEARGRLDAIC